MAPLSLVVILSRMLSALPLAWALWVGRFFGWFWYWIVPIRCRVARDNVRRAFGETLTPKERRRIVRGCCTHMALYALDTLRAPLMTPELSRQLVAREGFERLDAARANGTGAIVFMAHVGSLDLAGCSQAVLGLPIAVVVRDIGWPPAREFITLVREKTGLELLAPRNSMAAIRQALADNKIVCLAADQHAPAPRGIVCEFLGNLASTTPVPARLALQSGAPLHPAVIIRDGLTGHHHLRIEPRLELETPHADFDQNVRHNTERINRVIEGWVRQTPEQWLWMHKRWKVQDDPAGWDVPPSLQHLLP